MRTAAPAPSGRHCCWHPWADGPPGLAWLSLASRVGSYGCRWQARGLAAWAEQGCGHWPASQPAVRLPVGRPAGCSVLPRPCRLLGQSLFPKRPPRGSGSGPSPHHAPARAAAPRQAGAARPGAARRAADGEARVGHRCGAAGAGPGAGLMQGAGAGLVQGAGRRTHVAHELLAHGADVGGERGAEHHDLLVVGRLLEDGLQRTTEM